MGKTSKKRILTLQKQNSKRKRILLKVVDKVAVPSKDLFGNLENASELPQPSPDVSLVNVDEAEQLQIDSECTRVGHGIGGGVYKDALLHPRIVYNRLCYRVLKHNHFPLFL